MTDHERLLIALLSEDGNEGRRAVTVEEVVSMLYELGAEHRHRAYEGLLLVSV
jgi:hypothetical protein